MQPTPEDSALRAVELILDATFNFRQKGPEHNFLTGPPQIPKWAHSIVAKLFFSELGLLQTARHLRTCGPAYLLNLSIRELDRMITDFVVANYWLLHSETWGRSSTASFAKQVSIQTKIRLAMELGASHILRPRNVLTLFPLVTVEVATDFDSEVFFLIRPASLNSERLRRPVPANSLLPELFPPIPDWTGVRETPAAWLGIRSPTLSTSKKMRNAILGTIALLPHPRERHLFTGRKMFGGYITLDDGWTIGTGMHHTPPLSQNIVINDKDSTWLSILASKLTEHGPTARKQLNAIEYYYRAWALSEIERFPILFMALDAIFGDAAQATQSVVSAIGPVMGSTYDQQRLKKLMSLRASVIHGGAPDVYDSHKYFAYFEKYLTDPIYDLELIAARCLQSVVFENTLTSRPHTYAELIREKTGVEV